MSLFSLSQTNFAVALKRFFSHKYLPILCLLIAIINKSTIAYIYNDLTGDKSIYLLYAANYLEHNQFLEPISFIDTYQAYSRYSSALASPLYSFLAVPILQLTTSFTKTAFIIDVISWSIFLSAVYKLVTAIFNNRGITSLFILCAGFFIYPHELGSGPKDTLAVGLILWSVYALHRFIKNAAPGFLQVIFISVLLTGFALTKFLYVPLLLVLFTLLFYFSYRLKSKTHFLYSIFILILTVTACLSIYFILKSQTQPPLALTTAPGVKEFNRGFYPENLLQTFPFISSSFININFWCVQLASIFKKSYSFFSSIFNIIDLAILGSLVVGFKWLKSRIKARARSVFFTGMVVSLSIIAMVVIMSLFYEGILYPGRTSAWTYVSEARSFLLIIVFLQLLLFYLIVATDLNISLKNFLFLLFIIECAHGFYFTIKQASNISQVQQSVASGGGVKNTVDIANIIRSSHPDATLNLITNDDHLRWYARLHSINAFAYSPAVSCDAFTPLKNTIFLIATYEGSNAPFESCMENFELLNMQNQPPFIIKIYKKQ